MRTYAQAPGPSVRILSSVTEQAISVNVTKAHLDVAAKLVREARSRGGLAPVDLERFWADQEAARKNPFGGEIPQVPLGIGMSWECVFDELGIEEDYGRWTIDEDWRLELARAYNDKAEEIVGRRLIGEKPRAPGREYPPVRMLDDVFEAENVWLDRSWWLMPSAANEDELKGVLDRADERLSDIRAFMLPEDWSEEKERLTAAGVRPPLYRGQRGPVTFATSVFGAENLVYLIMDNEPLAVRFRDAILRAMLAVARVLDEEAGFAPATAPRGFSFSDDNCYLLNPQMYEFFALPIVEGVFGRYSPDPADRRYQHSDSDMAHLLPALGRLGLTGTNFGPTVTVEEIRAHCPRAVIEGQLAPFTFSRNEEENIVAEFLRDFEMAREKRGLRFCTAGSINNGSRLTGMRLVMAAIQRHRRYD